MEDYSNYEAAKEEIAHRWAKIWKRCRERNGQTCHFRWSCGKKCNDDICPRIKINISYAVKY